MKKYILPICVLICLEACSQISSKKQILRDVQILSADSLEGRATATAGGYKAQKYLLSRFSEIGFQSFGNSYLKPFEIRDKKANNIIGFIKGQIDSVIVISAHYDHLGIKDAEIFNGADDNASGVAGLLAIANSFKETKPKHTLIFAAFDAEELGLQGAQAFIGNPPIDKRLIKLNINMDMIAHNDVNEIYAVGTYHYPSLIPILDGVKKQSEITIMYGHDVPNSKIEDWTYSSDHGPFHKVGIPFVYFGVEDHEDYHKSTDTFESINQEFLFNAIESIIVFVKDADQRL